MHRPPAHGGLGRMYPRPAPAAPPPVSAEDLEVLVAEDNIMMASLMQLQLRQLGYRSHLCANGQEVGPGPLAPCASVTRRNASGIGRARPILFFSKKISFGLPKGRVTVGGGGRTSSDVLSPRVGA